MVGGTVKQFQADNLTDWAAALTYYGIMSLFPGLPVLISALRTRSAGVLKKPGLQTFKGTTKPPTAKARRDSYFGGERSRGLKARLVDRLLAALRDWDRSTAERVTGEFLATYYGGGVHQRGTMGLGPADVVIAALSRYADAGASDLCIRFIGDDQLAQF